MKRYINNLESFGKVILDKKYYCFKLIRNNPINLKNKLPSDLIVQNPIAIGVLVTNKCNLKCKYCYASVNPDSELTRMDFDLIVKKIKKTKILAIWISGGEPTLWPHLSSSIRELSKLNIGVTVDSNGSTNSTSLLRQIADYGVYIRISLDSHIPEIHNLTRGCFHKTWCTIQNLLKYKIKFGILTVVHKKNLFYLKEMASKLSSLGIKRWTLLKINIDSLSEEIKEMLYINDRIFDHTMSQVCSLAKNKGIFTTVVEGDKPNSTLLIGPDKNFYTLSLEGRKVLGKISNSSIEDVWGKKNGICKINHLKKYLNY